MKRGGPLARRTPLRAAKPLRRTAAPKKKARPKAETLRIYGTPEFRDFLHSHPCLWCGRTTGIEAAHLRGNGGTGRKDDWTSTGPLCGVCHDRHDRRTQESLWFNPAQRTSILQRLEKFHQRFREEI
jgi:hypothetical protein